MRRIDTTYWKVFRVGDLFSIHPTRAYKLINVKLLDDGDTPVVVNSAYNNGIGGYSTQQATEKGNMVTFSDTVDANTIFYQDRDYVGYPHVQGLYPVGEYASYWNRYCLMFFLSIFRKSALAKGFDYGYKFRRDIAIDIKIKLPSTPDGSPDWKYMEEYMRKIEQRTKTAISALVASQNKPQNIDTTYWKEFIMEELFEIAKGKRLTKLNMREGSINYIGATSFNNGITAKISNDKYIHSAGKITVCYNGSIGQTFFQDEPFWATDDVNVLYPKFKMSRFIALFLCPIISKIGSNYAYIDKWTANKMRISKILLPATPTGEPDWRYMEMYMRGVEAIAKEKIALLTKKKQEPVQQTSINNYGTVNIYEK